MTDQEFLIWIHQRLVLVHGEGPNVDYMHKLRAIIEQMDHTKTTPNVASPRYA
jgi:acetylglutamate kinase